MVSAILSIFGTLVRTHPITLIFYKNKQVEMLVKNLKIFEIFKLPKILAFLRSF